MIAQNSLVWHYTVGCHLPNILKAGVLKVEEWRWERHRQPRLAVWFTRADTWEQTACKGYCLGAGNGDVWDIFLDEELTHLFCRGLVRIGVQPAVAPYTWHDYKRLSGMPNRELKGLYDSTLRMGSRVGSWRLSFDPVPQSKWDKLEYWNASSRAWETSPSMLDDTPSEAAARLCFQRLRAGQLRVTYIRANGTAQQVSQEIVESLFPESREEEFVAPSSEISCSGGGEVTVALMVACA